MLNCLKVYIAYSFILLLAEFCQNWISEVGDQPVSNSNTSHWQTTEGALGYSTSLNALQLDCCPSKRNLKSRCQFPISCRKHRREGAVVVEGPCFNRTLRKPSSAVASPCSHLSPPCAVTLQARKETRGIWKAELGGCVLRPVRGESCGEADLVEVCVHSQTHLSPWGARKLESRWSSGPSGAWMAGKARI